jgi:hypothetical protein
MNYKAYSPNRAVLSLLAIGLLTGFVSVWKLHSTPIDASYQGDGKFTDTSGMRGPFDVQGYEVALSDLDLDGDHVQELKYRLDGLPTIGKACGVYLAIVDRDKKLRGIDQKQVGGLCEFEVTDSQGQLIAQASGALSDFIWAEGGKYELYQLDKSFFTPKTGEQYTLRVRFLTDPQLKGLRGYVWLRCGGSL